MTLLLREFPLILMSDAPPPLAARPGELPLNPVPPPLNPPIIVSLEPVLPEPWPPT